jgi:hypothetical protein
MTLRHLRKSGPILLAAACLVAGLAAPAAIAMAAPAASAKSAPLVAGSIGIQVAPADDKNFAVVLVDLVLDRAVKLPATVRVPIPPGGNVMWAGEVLGGDVNADPQRPYTVHQGTGGQYAELTLSQSHQAQIDTGGLPRALNGTTVSTTIEYVQSVPSTATSFSVRVPAGATDIKITPPPQGVPDSNAAGEHLYVMATQALSLGDKVAVSVSYKNAASGAAGGSSNNQTMLLIALGVALVAVIVALVFVQRARGTSAGAGESDDLGEDDADATYAGDASYDDDVPYDQMAGGGADSADDHAAATAGDATAHTPAEADDPFADLDDAFADDTSSGRDDAD